MPDIAHIEQKRDGETKLDAVYLLSPKPYVVDCLVSDLERHKYQRAYLIWTSRQSLPSDVYVGSLHTAVLAIDLRQRIDSLPNVRDKVALFRILNVEFFPRESHLITFRDPWSFPSLFHPACDSLVRQHMQDLTQKVQNLLQAPSHNLQVVDAGPQDCLDLRKFGGVSHDTVLSP